MTRLVVGSDVLTACTSNAAWSPSARVAQEIEVETEAGVVSCGMRQCELIFRDLEVTQACVC